VARDLLPESAAFRDTAGAHKAATHRA